MLGSFAEADMAQREATILRRELSKVTSRRGPCFLLWDQVDAIGRRLLRYDVALFERALRHSVIGLDQTGWPRLDGKADKPWQVWCITAPGVVCHRIRADKSAETFTALVGGYKGVIVCDALKTHEAGARDGPGILLAGCCAHVFRKFDDAAPDNPEAHIALGFIGELYDIDERAGDDIVLERQLRRTESAGVIVKLKTWLWSQAVLKPLSIGKAAAYTLANWQRLTRFLDDPLIPLDNNGTLASSSASGFAGDTRGLGVCVSCVG